MSDFLGFMGATLIILGVGIFLAWDIRHRFDRIEAFLDFLEERALYPPLLAGTCLGAGVVFMLIALVLNFL